MKTLISYFLCISIILFSSCSNDDKEVSWIEGRWELIEWNLDFEVDINEDGIKHYNLLEEIDCSSSEIIEFDSNKLFTSLIVHPPSVIGVVLSETDTLSFNVECGEGSIGTTGLHYSENDTIIVVAENDNITYVKEGDVLVKYDPNAITVYDKDLTEVISALETTKVFRKID